MTLHLLFLSPRTWDPGRARGHRANARSPRKAGAGVQGKRKFVDCDRRSENDRRFWPTSELKSWSLQWKTTDLNEMSFAWEWATTSSDWANWAGPKAELIPGLMGLRWGSTRNVWKDSAARKRLSINQKDRQGEGKIRRKARNGKSPLVVKPISCLARRLTANKCCGDFRRKRQCM